jgi:hypothetical protein
MSEAPPRGRLLLVTLLVVTSTVSWRRAQYFSGSLDPVVLAKGLLSVLALSLAYSAARRAPVRRTLGSGSLWLVAALLAGSAFGAFTHGTLASSGVVAVRVLIVGLTMYLLLRVSPAEQAFAALAWSCGAVALVAAASGWPARSAGRLSGGIPPLAPNELALLAAVVVLYVGWRAVVDRPSWSGVVAGFGGLAVMWETDSRTAMLVLVLALAVMVLHARRPPVGLVVGGLLLLGLGGVLLAASGAATGFLERGDTGTSTLDSRMIAWHAAGSWAPTLWQTAFGGGLSVKIIPVTGQFWTQQPLDSSWASIFVQGGLFGFVVAVVWVLWALHGALRAPRELRALLLPALVFLVGRSLLESGLFDATPAFLGFFAISLLVEGGSRARLDAELPSPSAVAHRGSQQEVSAPDAFAPAMTRSG